MECTLKKHSLQNNVRQPQCFVTPNAIVKPLFCMMVCVFKPDTAAHVAFNIIVHDHGPLVNNIAGGPFLQAVMYFRRALKLDRHYLSAWTLMGHEYVEMKNTSAAIGMLQYWTTLSNWCPQICSGTLQSCCWNGAFSTQLQHRCSKCRQAGH